MCCILNYIDSQSIKRIWTTGSCNDFAIQIQDQHTGLNLSKYTIVAYDLPGFGKSQINAELRCDPTAEYFDLGADIGAALMARLGHKTYSICGWNDGARVACLLAAKNPSRVNALLLWGFLPVMDKQSSHAMARARDTSVWDQQVLKYYTDVYGSERFNEMWHNYVDYVVVSWELEEISFDIRAVLNKIKCPTVVLHGEYDPFVDFNEHIKPLNELIYDLEIRQLDKLSHNIHQAAPECFNEIVNNLIACVSA